MLVIDNLSPYTGDILHSLAMLAVDHSCLRYFEVQSYFADKQRLDHNKIILSGRQKNSRETNAVNSKILKHCYETGKSVLGICYGAEIIALTFGGTIKKMQEGHVQGFTAVRVSTTSPLTSKKKILNVYESHRYCVAKLPEHFESIASSGSCEHEIFSHRQKNIFGTQFHPEKSERDGLELLSRFVNL